MEKWEEISETVKKGNNQFNFLDTLGEMTINEKFKEGLTELKAGYNNKNTYIWEVLSAMNADVSETIYDNVLHYIDNISNVDTCKISALKSMLKKIGIEYTLFSTYEEMPLGIQNIIDIFSINKRYLIKDGFLKSKLIDEIKSNCFINGSDSTEDGISNVEGYIDEDELYDYVKNIYINYLNSIVNLKYSDKEESTLSTDSIWYHLKDKLVQINEDIKVSDFKNFKTRHNISNKFDEVEIVDNIDNGKDFLDNYSGYELELLKLEIEKRSKPISLDRPQTKYHYYQEKIVKEYFDFIEYKFSSINNLNNISDAKYNVDNNYILITDKEKTVYEKLIGEESGNFYIKQEMIDSVAENLTAVTFEIQKLREKLKLEVQKNYMRGTYNLLKYIVNEYLIGLSKSRIFSDTSEDILKTIKERLSNSQIININHIEYYDTTEYYNIDSGVVKSNKLNDRYWEGDTIDYQTDFAFSEDQISNFYQNTLNCKDKVTNINNFLCSLYEYGATKTYIQGNQIVYQNDSEKEAEYEILMSYGGQPVTYNPYSNHKNSIHPSFQLHPYLNRFIAYTGYEYPIENAFYNDANQGLEDAIVSNLIGEYGEVINVALNNQYDFSGYKTRYEESPHMINGNVSKIVDYDGAFYPQAAIDFKNDTENFINSIRNQTIDRENKTYYEKYYSHLGLTKIQTEKIADQLEEYKDLIKEIVDEKESINDVHDIYKYATDRYENIYVLYKKYDSDNPSYNEKQNTTGQLWVRLKDHPIAFPAFYGNNPNVDNSENYINGNIHLLAMSDIGINDPKTDKNKMSYFYDFEIDETKRTIFLVAYPKNDSIDHNTVILEDEKFKQYQFADIIICNFDSIYDPVDKLNKLRFLSDTEQHITYINTSNIVPIDKIIGTNKKVVNCLLGIFRREYSLNAIYIQKYLDDENNVYIDNDLTFTIYDYIYRTKYTETYNISLSLSELQGKYFIVNDDIKFSYLNEIFTFAFLVNQNNNGISQQTYIGLGSNTVQVNETDLSCEEGCYNSFDKLEQSICIYESVLNGTNFISDPPKIYNLNVDASYIPQFAGIKGFHDYSDNIFIEKENVKSIQLMGQSTNLLRDIKNDITDGKFFTLENFEKINEFICGRIYEDYFEEEKKNEFRSFQLDTMSWRGTFNDDNDKIWIIDIDDSNPEKLSAFNFVIGNRYTTSDNLYFIGSILDISSDNPFNIYNDGFISLKDKYHSYDEQPKISEIQDSTYEAITVAGTYNMYEEHSNKPTSNHLFGVKDIQVKFEGSTNELMIRFITEDHWLINDNELYIASFNKEDLRMYEWYHLMEPVCLSSYSQELLSIELSNYSNLSDIWQLRGHDALAFKYSEDETFEPSDIRFWYPGHNSDYPLRVCEIFDHMKEEAKTADYSNKYVKLNSTYILKMNDMSQFLDLKEIELPIYSYDTNCLLVFEDYLSTDIYGYSNENKYDTSSIKMMEFTNNTDISSLDNIKESQLNTYIAEQSPNVYLDDKKSYIYQNFGIEVLYTEDIADNQGVKPLTYSPKLSNLIDIEKFNNIYVQYDKSGDNIILYFNYMNLYNTPFVKINDGVQSDYIIDNTYLKLYPGEDGILDIDVQIRNYSDNRTVDALANIKIASYRIFNVSDDKPKFLIQKITDDVKVLIDNGQYENLFATITISSKEEDMGKFKTDERLSMDLNIGINPRCPLESLQYQLLYPSDKLTLISDNDNVEDNNGIISISSVNSIQLKFETKEYASYYFNNNIEPEFMFTIIEYECYAKNGEEVECEYFNGVIKFKFDEFLRLESDNRDDLILLQNDYKILIKEINNEY